MDFVAVVDQAIALLRQRGRLTYRTLQLQFQLDEAHLEALKNEIIESQRLAVDEARRILVWTGGVETLPSALPSSAPPGPQPATQQVSLLQTALPPAVPSIPEAERRQLTVLFCDLVDSTALSSQLDPEDLREVVRAYQDTCAKVIARFDGHIAQYLGDGLLVYFGYPRAHEDDAQRAVRAGLGMVEALGQLNSHLKLERGVALAVRLGIHTGLVVVGEVGSGTRQEQLALGETPNLAARLQGIAAPNTVVISATTFQLLGGFFACQPLGTPPLKGQAQPLAVYRMLYESMARSRLEAVGSTGWTPLVGREQEIEALRERWAQVKEGVGQVVLLSGEAGIGKSRLVQVLMEHVAAEPQAWLTPCQCSPYHQNTALYPLIDLLERVTLRFDREESAEQRLRKLEGFVVQYGLPLVEAVPLFAALLSLPLGAEYAPLTLSPEQQKQKTLQAFLAIFRRIAAQQPVLFVMEDLHWLDPSTLEFLTLLVDQGPTARILALFTCRPDFSPPWTGRSHLTRVTLPRLPRRQAAEMTTRMAHGKALPAEMVAQVVAKTDGVPLFVEELTKMVLESGLLQEREERYELTGPLPPLAIPATLHDSLMARLDRLAAVKSLAQLGATLGREFSYELLHAVSPWDEATVQRALHQLVEAEFLYQRGLPPQATYLFKHALIQDAAYQSLLRSTRQQYHQRVAQVLEARFPAICTAEPEVLAHHYSEAGLHEQAVAYWQLAGERAVAHSAHMEAIAYFTKGLEGLTALPDSAECRERELTFQLALGRSWMASKGYAAPEVEHVYARAQKLCRQMGDTPRVPQILLGLGTFYFVRGAFRTAQDLSEQCLSMVQRLRDTERLQQAHLTLGTISFHLGSIVRSRDHLEQSIALYTPQQSRVRAVQDPGVAGHAYAAWVLWVLGYPTQALQRSYGAITLADELSHQLSRVYALLLAATLHQHRREAQAIHERTEAAMSVLTEQDFLFWQALGTVFRGWLLVGQGRGYEGIALMGQGTVAWQATGAEMLCPYLLGLQAEAYGNVGQTDRGLTILDEALAIAGKHDERIHEAELYRVKGELLLQLKRPDIQGAASCFCRALDIARHQQAKSWELRAATSLARLWQQQGQHTEARALLAPIYGWFTEGFDTPDLREARALLEELGR